MWIINFSLLVFFVKGSAKFSSDFTYSTSKIPFSMYSFTNRYLVWMCLVLLIDEFLVINIAPLLSTMTLLGKLMMNPKNSRIIITNMRSFHTSEISIYLASDDDWETTFCCFDPQTIGLSFRNIIQPEILFLLTLSPPQSLST